MTNFVYVFTNLVSFFLMALEMMMFIRAVLSWLPIDDDSPVVSFVYAMTEPVIAPVRILLERSETVRSLPIDLSFFVAFILLSVVQMLLP